MVRKVTALKMGNKKQCLGNKRTCRLATKEPVIKSDSGRSARGETSKRTQLPHSFAMRHPVVWANKTILILPLTVWWPGHWSRTSIDHPEVPAARSYLLETLLWYSCPDNAVCSDLSEEGGETTTTTPRLLELHKNSMEMKWPSNALLFRERNESCSFAKDGGLDLVCGNYEPKVKTKCELLSEGFWSAPVFWGLEFDYYDFLEKFFYRFAEKTRRGGWRWPGYEVKMV